MSDTLKSGSIDCRDPGLRCQKIQNIGQAEVACDVSLSTLEAEADESLDP